AKSKASAFIHGAFLLLSILLIPSVINLIPLSALACILIITGYKLAKVSMIREIYAQGREQFVPFVATIAAILFTDLLKGIAIGMVVAAYFILRRNIRNPYYLNTKKHIDGEKVKLILAEEVSFLNKPSIIDALEGLPKGTKVTIDGGRSKYIDSDVIEYIQDFKVRSALKNIEVNFIGSNVPLERQIDVPVSNGKDDYHELFKNNREWVQQKIKADGSYFENMAEGQSPKFLWIGCSDSRVDPNSITGTEAGDMFIHRNIANLVVHTDMNLMSVLQYSVEVLKVKHVIVCGHYGCGGIKAATDGTYHGLIDKWLRNIKDVYRLYSKELESINDVDLKQRRLVELNVREQVYNLCKTSIIQKALNIPEKVKVYGWVYDIREGLVHDLKIDVEKDFPDFSIYKIKEIEEIVSV
ncbi:MAG TPA: carbonic anhydrase, partial [Cytophagaceae bacterium]